MSRSRPEERKKNPATKWIDWDGDKGGLRYYDKEAKKNVPIDINKMKFMVLGQAYAIGGFNEADKSNLTSNQIRDSRKEPLTVRLYPNNIIAKGLYADIKDIIKAKGGKFMANVYAAVKSKEGYSIVVIQFKGAAFSSWLDFKRTNNVEKDAVIITGTAEGKKGKVVYQTPIFDMVPVSEEENKAAYDLDVIVQEYLDSVMGVDQLDVTQPEVTSFSEDKDDFLQFETQRQIDRANRNNAAQQGIIEPEEDDDLPWE